jgi:hypothetical protein
LEYDFAQWLAGFTELLFFVPNGAVSALPQQCFHAGLQIFFGDNIQFDIHSAVGPCFLLALKRTARPGD